MNPMVRDIVSLLVEGMGEISFRRWRSGSQVRALSTHGMITLRRWCSAAAPGFGDRFGALAVARHSSIRRAAAHHRSRGLGGGRAHRKTAGSQVRSPSTSGVITLRRA
ncbi:hypothetical protein LTV02_04570 [Nocardia yamanashiensis]|uniref:hypothetical protein n=1 Tax=Nocardia yamanashiensis TaxID=209247 RepID=UPI001E4D09CE|nr:hypothetical protein [Nocardia yamanashiensis]UGT42694.1 hypothetical protein LTV02_04570 [Nocardia yamanashiensis]